MPNSIRPGDVLADRYLLVDLLSESGNGRFWRAHDRTLERHVAVHVVSATDERAPGMMAAARSSAAVHDRRLLRVLDVDERDGLCYVVNEWGAGSSVDVLVSREGPMSPRRAAWVVSEVAESIAIAHQAGIAHGRLVPENVLIDETGGVRVIGFSVDAALLGLPPGRLSSDVTDLAGLLYFLLAGKWAGVSRSAMPNAPQEAGRVLRPRQVKAGIPRPLDALCDELINGSPLDNLPDARGLGEALADFVGDTAGMAAAEAATRNGRGSVTQAMPRAPELDEPGTDELAAVPPTEAISPPTAAPDDPPTESPSLSDPAPAPASTDRATDLPTQAGMPIFDDTNDDVSWFQARAETPAPPPPFDPPPERPLFAPEPTDGAPVRRSRPSAVPGTSGRDYWPWDTGAANTGSGVLPILEEEDDNDGVPGRSWFRLAIIVGLCTLLLVAVVFAFNMGRGRSPLGDLPGADDSPSASESTATSLQPLAVAAANDLDPQGDPPEENSEIAPLVIDGDPSTSWRTVTYTQNLGPGGLKTGVGLVLDLGESQEVARVDLTMVGAPTDVRLYLSDDEPQDVKSLDPVAEETIKAKQRVTLDEPTSGRYLVIWLTSLPKIPGGYRGEVAEAVVRG